MARKKPVSLSSAAEAAAVQRLLRFKIAVPSWGFADSGTRFGKFLQPAAAVDLEDKLADAGMTHACTGMTPLVAAHMMWDFPEGFDPAVPALARKHGVRISSISPCFFGDQDYKFGSVTNRDAAIRRKTVRHMLDAVQVARKCGSRELALWFADGTNYPGQGDIVQRKGWATDALQQVHQKLPADMIMLVEYKPFEPATYFMDFFDWGSAYIYAKAAGPRAKVLVDLGHHLQGCNIEQIVAWLIDEDMLGGFHLNDRKYADDDLMTGAIDPYQAFRIFNEIVAAEHRRGKDLDIAYMVDQSHNVEPKVQAMIRTAVTIQELMAKALCVDRPALATAQRREDTVASEEILRRAFFADVEPLLRQVRSKLGCPADPLAAYRASGYEAKAAKARTAKRKAMGMA
ncbi:MAG: TIM barrel protein [Phycisphaerae bacterium]